MNRKPEPIENSIMLLACLGTMLLLGSQEACPDVHHLTDEMSAPWSRGLDLGKNRVEREAELSEASMDCGNTVTAVPINKASFNNGET